MCETYLHPRPEFATFLRSDANSRPFSVTADKRKVKYCARSGKRISNGSRDIVHITPASGQALHPIFTPLLDTVSGTINSAIEQSYTGRKSFVSSGAYANFFQQCNISKAPQETTPSLNSKQELMRPQTAPGRIIRPTTTAEQFKSPETLTEELISRFKVATYDNADADIDIKVHLDGTPDYRIVSGQMMPCMKISLPPSQPERDALELKTRYTSVSHKTMAEIPWPAAGVSAPVSKPKREVKPDVVTEKVPRYEEKAHAWQALGPAFDRASPRRHFLSAKPINYTSESRQTRYTPGYTGRVALKCGELGVPDIDVVKKTEVHRELPPPTSVARKANIVGYTGIVKPGSVNHAHYNAPCTTQLRTHRSYPPIGKSQGPMYPRVNPVSNMVSLTHPYNPYNKINPTVKPRA